MQESRNNFNSIKVRLEQLRHRNKCQSNQFQFHKGAIRTQSFETNLKLSTPFQFHKGAIRTIDEHQDPKCWVEFQFHKGAIRTLEGDLLAANLSISIP